MLFRLNRLPLRSVANARPPRRIHRPLAGFAVLTGGVALTAGYVYADSLDSTEAKPSLGTLIRSYTVYTMCSIPSLVEYSPKILETLMGIPVLRQVTEVFVRATFFNHFVGGDTAEGTIPLLHAFRKANKGALLAYSVEVDPSGVASSHSATSKDDLPHKRIIREIIHSIDVAADFEDDVKDGGRRTWVAVKMTALLPNAEALVSLSRHLLESHARASSSDSVVPFPGCPRPNDLDVLRLSVTSTSSYLTQNDVEDLRELYDDLRRVCLHAQDRGVKVIFDAEWSWYQPAIDALALELMREFNGLRDSKSTVRPLVYTTYQAYLRRTPAQLALSLEDARKHKYALGIKLVRGAYHPYEIAAHHSKGSSSSISPDELPPVWFKKEETDRCYNDCVRTLLRVAREDIGEGTASSPRQTSGKSWKPWISWLPGYSSAPVQHLTQHRKLPSIGILFGTHNWESATLILDELVRNDLAEALPEQYGGERVVRVKPEAVERVAIAQLKGMSDDLTQYLVRRTKAPTPFVIKYVPYGALVEVIPYLSRRAIENKSVLGDGKATHERKMAGKEIWKRITGRG